MVREILVNWTLSGRTGPTSVLYFGETGTVADQRLALSVYLGAVDAYQQSTTQWTIETEGRELNTATGALTGVWAHATAYTGAGAATTGSSVADATQALQRWHTGNIVGGRFLAGRTFLPGWSNGHESSGNISSTSQAGVLAAANTLLASGANLVVWHRPQNGSGGQAFTASTASVWKEFAVLRNRRG